MFVRDTMAWVALQTNFKIGWFQNVWKNQIARPEVKLINKIYGRISVLVKCKRRSHRGNFSGKNGLQSRNLPCGRTGQFALRLYCCCYLLFSVNEPGCLGNFNDRKMVKQAQQTITCRCSLARTKSSTATTTTSAR